MSGKTCKCQNCGEEYFTWTGAWENERLCEDCASDPYLDEEEI